MRNDGAMMDIAHDELEARASKITDPEFIGQVVYPAAREGAARGGPSIDCKTTIVQDRGTGRITLNYAFDDGTLVFGKLYSDELARHSFQALDNLWKGGFGNDQPYQISQPLLYVPEHRLLLTKAVEGTPLESFVGRDCPELVPYVRQAAKWLVQLHSSSIRVGRDESLWQSLKLFKVIRRLAKASALVPERKDMMIEMVNTLCDRGKQSQATMHVVQTHGRFHYEHILVNGSKTTVIDFDRSLPSDPAKDLAEFVSMLRLRTFKLSGSAEAADAPTQAFLGEYLSHLPENAANLAIHWGAFLLLTLLRHARKPAAESSGRVVQFCQKEFDSVLSASPVPGMGANFPT